MLDNETKRRIDTARDILVGKVPDPKSQVEQITIALIYKFMDDMDKEAVELGWQPSFFTGDYERYAWNKIFDPRIGGHEMLGLYGEAITKLNQNPNLPQLFRDIFKNAYLPYRDPETLKLFLKTINEFSYDHSERLGDAFEYLLSVLGSQGDAGQFRTPRHIIDFMVQIVNPQKHETVLDPACGTAGFLISSYKHILKENCKKVPGDLLDTEDRKKILTNFKGYDISPDMVRLSLVNMYLHGFVQPQIVEYDTLTSDERWNEYADVILANPPFMSPKGGIKPHKKFSVQSNRSEVLFVDYIAEHLTPTGRAAVIVPEGIIFQSATAYKTLRKMLVENYLYAVVSLPAGVFNPYSGVKTSILLMDKQLAKKTDSILFVKIENDGFDLGDQRRPIDKNDLPEALKCLNEWKKTIVNKQDKQDSQDKQNKNVENPDHPVKFFGGRSYALLVKKEKIAENGEYNLTGERYKIVETRKHQKWPMVNIGDICEVLNGFAFKSEKYVNEGIRVIRITNVQKGKIIDNDPKFYPLTDLNEIERFILEKGDLLLSLTGNVGRVGLISESLLPAALNQRVACLRVTSEKILHSYLYSILNTDLFENSCIDAASGVAQKNLSTEWVKKFQIPLPPLEVQREIVAEIEGYQKLIDGCRQVVDAWKPQIDIDPEWPMVKLGEVCEIISGGTPPTKEKSYYDNGTIPWLKSEVCKDVIINQASTFITEAGLKNSSAKMLKANSTLIALVGATIGKTGFITFEASTNQNVAGLYPLDTNILSELFLFYTAQGLYGRFMSLGDGNFKMANLSFVKSLEIHLPPFPVQQEIVSKIEAERKVIDGCRELIKTYEEKIKRVIYKVWEG
jgi:type I restriction enzyme M protein